MVVYFSPANNIKNFAAICILAAHFITFFLLFFLYQTFIYLLLRLFNTLKKNIHTHTKKKRNYVFFLIKTRILNKTKFEIANNKKWTKYFLCMHKFCAVLLLCKSQNRPSCSFLGFNIRVCCRFYVSCTTYMLCVMLLYMPGQTKIWFLFHTKSLFYVW